MELGVGVRGVVLGVERGKGGEEKGGEGRKGRGREEEKGVADLP